MDTRRDDVFALGKGTDPTVEYCRQSGPVVIGWESLALLPEGSDIRAPSPVLTTTRPMQDLDCYFSRSPGGILAFLN